ncbi:hypothetical protein F53441_8842 [Fusarium austroafricanum]|uniref:Uncharacterized protein n=1 Tax=Fusarium austroafricanum TaxID=2364996 RepID=A0A8H4KDL7_9HYPO|nr:hypothetical protein F53441_8842 [Fusarium austroafricanum]
MAFYFQPPIFGPYILPMGPQNVPPAPIVSQPLASFPVYWQHALLLPSCQPNFAPSIKIKAIYHRAGTVLASNDACYNCVPPRDTVLANLSWWSQQHGLGDKAYTRQCTLYLTRSNVSTLTIHPRDGPITPRDLVNKVSFGEVTESDFYSMMTDINRHRYGAFILVDHAYKSLQVLAEEDDENGKKKAPSNGLSNNTTNNTSVNSADNTQSTLARQPSPPNPPAALTNTNAPDPSNTGTDTNSPEPSIPVTTDSSSTAGGITGISTPKGADSKPGSPKVGDKEPEKAE